MITRSQMVVIGLSYTIIFLGLVLEVLIKILLEKFICKEILFEIKFAHSIEPLKTSKGISWRPHQNSKAVSNVAFLFWFNLTRNK